MPETITITFAFNVAAALLIATWIGIIIGFLMGRTGAGAGRRTKEPRFNPGSTEIDEKTPWDEALESEEEEIQRIETLPPELQGGPE